MSDLLETYLVDLLGAVTAFEAACLELRLQEEGTVQARQTQTLGTLGVLAHRMAGTAALYGQPQTASLAGLAERLLDAWLPEAETRLTPAPRLAGPERQLLCAVLERAAWCLRMALDGVASGHGEGQLGLRFAEVGGPEALRALLSVQAPTARPGGPRRAAPAPDGAAPPVALPAPPTHPMGALSHLRAFTLEQPEVWAYFAPEVREHLAALQGNLDAAREGAAADLAAMFRASHTIKGSAYMVGLPLLGDLAHHLEDLMLAVRDGRLPLDGPAGILLQQGVTLCERLLLGAEGQPAGQLDHDLARLPRQFQALLGGEPDWSGADSTGADSTELAWPGPQTAPPDPAPTRPALRSTIRVDTERLDRLMDGVSELVVARARLERTVQQLGAVQGALHASAARAQRVMQEFETRYLNPERVARAGAAGDPDTAPEPARGAGQAGSTVQEIFAELEFDSYSDLNILARAVGELRADLDEVQAQLDGQASELRGETEQLGSLIRGLRGEVGRTRRVPFAQALTRLRRWARERGSFELVVAGEALEIDAYVVEGLAEALLHLATNAAVHGLESGAERVQAGKPARGRLSVQAEVRGNLLLVSVQDDGRGIDLERVREQALSRGLRSGRELAALSAEQTLRLILLPGLSTARTVTGEAGRGVGMDVVATTARRLGGELLPASTPGVGSRFTLRLPLSQQVTELLLTRVAGQPLGFALSSVGQLLELGWDDLPPQTGAHLTLPGGVPLYPLHLLWGRHPERHAPLRAVLTETDEGRVAFGVDSFEGIHEVVLRPLGAVLSASEYLAGATTLPGGEAVPLAEAGGLRRAVQRAARLGPAAPLAAASAAGPAPTLPSGRLLLVDDSLSVRRVMGRALERAGYRVETAVDGQAALDLLRADPDYAAVVTDLEMPRVSGFELIEELRRRPATATLPVVVMTTRAGEKHQRLAFALGASDYLSKPVDEQVLARCLAAPLHPAGLAAGSVR